MNQLFLFLIMMALWSCQPTITQLDSDDFITHATRIAALEQEIIIQSPLQQAEFELFNVNGFAQTSMSLPGASSWDYKVALKVAPSAIAKWTVGFRQVAELKENLDWMEEIIQSRKEEWLRTSAPEFFVREDTAVYMIVYRKEGFIFKRMSME